MCERDAMEMSMNDELEPRRCGLYLPGHEVHWIQALRSGNDTEHRPVPGHLVEVGSDGHILLDVEGRERQFWDHQPDRIALLAGRVRNRISVQWRWRILRVASAEGSYLFYLADPLDHRPCPAQLPEGDPVDLLTTAGGWTMRGDDPRLSS